MTGALTIRPAGDEDRLDWDRFVSRTPDSEAAHRWDYHMLLAELFGARLFRLIAWRDDRIVGILPLVYQKSLVGRFLTSVPYLNHAGVSSEDPEARERLAEEAGNIAAVVGAQRLELRGRQGDDLPLPQWLGKSGYTLDLSAGTEALWKQLKSKVRAQVRRPTKEGYTTRVVGGADYDIFYRVLARRWHQLGSPILPRRFFDRLGRVFGDDLRFVLVEKDARAVAAGALLEWRRRVEIPWAASDLEHNRFGVNMLLYWTAIESAVSASAREFDFGRSTPGTGNAKFKLQWGAIESPLVWNVQTAGGQGDASVRGAGRRDLVARTWRRLPSFIVGRLGPFLAARIPY